MEISCLVVHSMAYIWQYVVILAWHADTTEHSGQIQTGALVVAGVGMTLVDVGFTSWASVPHDTITLKSTWCVDTRSSMFTRGYRT
jgi:hypothetical protein